MERKTGVPGEKTLGSRMRTNNKFSPHMPPSLGGDSFSCNRGKIVPKDENDESRHIDSDRLLAVSFWLVKGVHLQRGETGTRRKKREETGPQVPSLVWLFSSAILRALSTIQKGTASSLQ